MKKITIDDIIPVKDYMICTIEYIGKKVDSAIFLDPDTKKKLMEDNQPVLKIRRVAEDSPYKVGQKVLIADGRINATVIKIDDQEWYVLPTFEIRCLVNE